METLPVPGMLTAKLISGSLELSLKHKIDPKVINRVAQLLVHSLGLDIGSQHFAETPARIAKLWTTFLSPASLTLKAFETRSNTLVLCRNHPAVTLCPHHLLPVEMFCDLAYIPNGWALGLSKLPRLLDLIGSSFMLQEELTDTVVKLLDRLLMPKGVACRVVARHGCMRLRGVRTPGEVITTSVSGVYLTDEKARSEFLSGLDNHVFNGVR